jgi:hypothetical protein
MELLTDYCGRKLGVDTNVSEIIKQIPEAHYVVFDFPDCHPSYKPPYTWRDPNRLHIWVDYFCYIQRIHMDGDDADFPYLFNHYLNGKEMTSALGRCAVRYSGKKTYSMLYPDRKKDSFCNPTEQIHLHLNMSSIITGYEIG